MTGSPGSALLHRLLGSAAADPCRLLDAILVEQAAGPRTSDGRRTSPLTPAGYPVELSLSVGREPAQPAASVRFCATPGTRHRFFSERLAATRRACASAGHLVAGPLQDAWTSAATSLLEATFPEPARIPARTGLVGAVGVAAGGTGIVGLRLYLTARHLDRPGMPPGTSHLIAVDVDASGHAAERRYVGVPSIRALPDLATDLVAVLDAASLPRAVLERPAIVATDGVTTTAHLSAGAWAAAGVGVDDALARLAALLPAGPATLAHWEEAGRGDPLSWGWTITGLGADGGELRKLNAYLAPASR